MKIRCLVARMDGSSESGFTDGAIKPTSEVPVTRNFDHSDVIGKADVSVEGTDVYAEVTLRDDVSVDGLYPAVGGLSDHVENGVFHDFTLMTIGVCNQPNADPHVPPIGGQK